jgi:hypothetical protein
MGLLLSPDQFAWVERVGVAWGGLQLLLPLPASADAGHTSFDVTSWTISAPGTFVASGTETDTFRGMKETHPFTNEDTGIPATPGHYNTTNVLGFTAPGVAIQIQVAFRPAT